MDGVGGGGAPPALEKNAAELTVMDVYDIASAVGQEFERVIDQHGCEAIARLMPKVVRVLEILEVLVSRNHINPEMEELRLELDRLRLERMDRIEKERKHQKPVFKFEEDVGSVGNARLSVLQLKGPAELWSVWNGRAEQATKPGMGTGQLQQQQNRLMKINHDLRHRITVVEAQGKALIEQKVELEAYLQTKEQEMGNLRAELGKLREKLQGEGSQESHNGEEVKAEPNNEDCLSEAEKMAMDLKDPNRPRFTLQELRDVLHERNELKSRVFLLQEELLYYKSEEMEEETRPPQPPPIIQSKPSTQPESGIKRLFSFFSRDKKRLQASQKNVHFQGTFREWSNSSRDDSYMEQGQEALQHL
ncbi:RILP-like protein 1 [Willisornis vidua]|uniref:RILP-like protein 1 n=1 Tax=Willisornis vidua TaxID=1566151 RepID=A0ABQ9DIQ0_9PASS|nr:RILP-like protein 1 [Willisornis vidua]